MKDALKGVFGNLITADKLRSIGNPGKPWNQKYLLV
jgi:hypothetical protein